jgi:hypothetical protein
MMPRQGANCRILYQCELGKGNPAASVLPAGLSLGVQPFTVFGSPVVNFAAVNISLEPLLCQDSQHSDTLIREWGVNAELTHDLNDNWKIPALANWSKSDSRFSLTGLPVQSRVANFDTVDLFFKYDVPGESLILKNLGNYPRAPAQASETAASMCRHVKILSDFLAAIYSSF